MPWAVPYLPIDPKDVGRSYEAVIRVNSQSGKGGVAYLMKTEQNLDLPRRLQIEFARIIQARTDTSGGEVSSDEIWAIFRDEYLVTDDQPWSRISLSSYQEGARRDDGRDTLVVEAFVDGEERTLEGTGNGPIAAFLDAVSSIGIDVQVLDYSEHAMSSGRDAQAASYLECAVGDRVLWGVGVDTNIVRASLKAVTSAVNRAFREERVGV